MTKPFDLAEMQALFTAILQVRDDLGEAGFLIRTLDFDINDREFYDFHVVMNANDIPNPDDWTRNIRRDRPMYKFRHEFQITDRVMIHVISEDPLLTRRETDWLAAVKAKSELDWLVAYRVLTRDTAGAVERAKQVAATAGHRSSTIVQYVANFSEHLLDSELYSNFVEDMEVPHG
jgi:hypothetical protein